MSCINLMCGSCVNCYRSARFTGVSNTGFHSSTHDKYMGSCDTKVVGILGFKSDGTS